MASLDISPWRSVISQIGYARQRARTDFRLKLDGRDTDRGERYFRMMHQTQIFISMDGPESEGTRREGSAPRHSGKAERSAPGAWRLKMVTHRYFADDKDVALYQGLCRGAKQKGLILTRSISLGLDRRYPSNN